MFLNSNDSYFKCVSQIQTKSGGVGGGIGIV